jgi:methylated-DNA-[protein]-cysteine S-methyltransferase
MPSPYRSSDGVPMLTHTTMGSPLGELTLMNDDGVLVGVWMGAVPAARAGRLGEATPEGFAQAIEELDAYFAGGRTAFEVPIELRGNAFDRRVWDLLLEIPFGETRSYGGLARDLGDVGLARAVGVANARNPIPIIVPCHRVIGSDGSLTGYGGGLERKRILLDLEDGRTSLFRPPLDTERTDGARSADLGPVPDP